MLKDDHYLENDDDDEIEIVKTTKGKNKQQDGEVEDDVNDWDVQIVDDDGKEETKKQQSEKEEENPSNNLEDTDDEEEEYDEYNPFVRKSEATSTAQRRNQNQDKLDIDYVAKLNSDERTSIIEDLKRKHYMESRREYLKVAYNPEQFGSTQITNFLKSTKLNKDISAMAKKATKIQEEQLKTSNSDGTSRIIFEKDTDIQQEEQATTTKTTKSARRKQMLSNLIHGYQRSAGRTDDDSDDDDDDIDWQDGHHEFNKHNPSGDNYFSRKSDALDDDDDDDDDGSEEDDDEEKKTTETTAVPLEPKTYQTSASGGGFLVPVLTDNQKQTTSPTSKNQHRRKVIHIDDDDDEEDDNDLDTKLPAKSDAMIAQELQDEALARALQEADDDDDQDGGGGGFLPDNGGGFLPSNDGHPDDDDNDAVVVEKVVLTVHDSVSDDEMKQKDQEHTDEALARSLQEAEYENADDVGGVGGFLVSNKPVSDFGSSHSNILNHSALDGDGGGGFLPDDAQINMDSAQTNISNNNAEADRENIYLTANFNTSKTTMGVGSQENDDDDDDDDDVDWEDGDEQEELAHQTLVAEPKDAKQETNVKESMVETPAEKKTNEHTEGKDKLTVSSKSTAGKSVEEQTMQKESTDVAMNNSPSYDEFDEESIDEEMEEESGAADFLIDDDWKATSSSKTAEEMAAALEHAQETAANLTNWAGRAFRRAVAEHAAEQGMEVPESLKPKALKNDTVEKETISTVPDILKPQANPSNDTHVQQVTQASSQNARNNDVDNSEWINSMVDTGTSAPIYSAAAGGTNSGGADPSSSMDAGVTDEMRGEVMQLLRLFGIPYVVAPAEAEAQCCMLEQLGLVDGVVTEDSDAFVFGGQVVYKNIFDDQKYVEVYHAKDAVSEMNLTRDSMVALAMLLGGDYTEGVKGVGIVNGMEVLQAFEVADGVKNGLTRFRKWLDGFDPASRKNDPDDPSSSELNEEQKFHRKHRSARARWIPPKYFPDEKVLNAYLNPVVDTSEERFSWGTPDLDALIAFCHGRIGWPPEETKKLVLPVIERLNQGSMRQTRIDSFMRYEDGIKFASIRSKRLREVLEASSSKASKGEKDKKKN